MKTESFERESFIFYRSFYKSIANCPEDAQLVLFKAVSAYALDLIEPEFPDTETRPYLVAIWEGIRPQLDANHKRFINGCKGGAPIGSHNNPSGRRGNKTNQELTKNKPNVNDNDNVNVNVNVNLSLPYESKEFVDTWNELRKQPKWRNKTKTALQKSLNQLKPYPESFAIMLMNESIANNYQGLVYSDTWKRYQDWMRSQPVTPSTTICKNESIYKKPESR